MFAFGIVPPSTITGACRSLSKVIRDAQQLSRERGASVALYRVDGVTFTVIGMVQRGALVFRPKFEADAPETSTNVLRISDNRAKLRNAIRNAVDSHPGDRAGAIAFLLCETARLAKDSGYQLDDFVSETEDAFLEGAT